MVCHRLVARSPGACGRSAHLSAVIVEQHDEWEAGDRRYFSETSMIELRTTTTAIEEATLPELNAAQAEPS